MIDFNVVLNPGDYQAGSVNVVVEISKDSIMKIEYRRHEGYFALDRLEPGIFAKPANYGFIPQTLDEDGDELDVLLLCDAALPMGVVAQGKIVGVLNFEDDGEMDHKIICVLEDDRHWGNSIKTLDDVSEQWKRQVEHHFTHYKDLKKPGSTKVMGWGDIAAAQAIVAESIERFNAQK